MSRTASAPTLAPRIVATTARRIRRRLAALLLRVVAAVAEALGYRLLRIRDRGSLGVADGAVPYRTRVFDEAVPGVANLDPALLAALRRAAADAAAHGVAFTVNSGWRSPEYQRQLRREAVARYGSEAAAARWVSTPETSAHVAGDAVDIGPPEAAAWLSEHGAAYGLCRIYRNEPWHFELRPEAIEHGCPPMYADPGEDPRTRR
ncbi:M15 family metallopeptidase [Glycomyces sp. TRM65418]|uniref:M15 family metallopeptidase n=1 Tax=Glycomyces sp. TRM65418 TaxID=2867006 RepID=UPI001CE58B20|nr:M15 family metallopeptidase [Glycomyces sp. TRM65418]MCC3765857.1 M15 family metallopeptidase [Glycomyces sp. TRM65418]QZD55442.1 M15 family metallopeptidase [Glycomyces sp. TRM65418]